MAKLTWGTTYLEIEREEGDPKRFTNGGWGSGESAFLYWLKGLLNKQGHDLIKKRMWKDGHMVSDEQQYLRVRDKKAIKRGCPNIAVWNGRYALEDLAEEWNKYGIVTVFVEQDFL